jgi:hypothetical protein
MKSGGPKGTALNKRRKKSMREPGLPAEEISRRGEALYEQKLRDRVEAGNTGKILVLDIDTGDYEIDDDHLTAVRRARARNPEATLYARRIGYPALGRIGGRFSLSTRRAASA